jgi:hypothetical protein
MNDEGEGSSSDDEAALREVLSFTPSSPPNYLGLQQRRQKEVRIWKG